MKQLITLVLILIEVSSQNKILEHFEQKLNKINDRLQKSRVPYTGKVKRYRCIEEYITVDEYGNAIEEPTNGYIFTTQKPPQGYESVTSFHPTTSEIRRKPINPTINKKLIDDETTNTFSTIKKHKTTKKDEIKNEVQQSTTSNYYPAYKKLTKIQITRPLSKIRITTTTTHAPTTTEKEIENPKENDRMIEELYLKEDQTQNKNYEKAATSPARSRKPSTEPNQEIEEDGSTPIRSQIKKYFSRVSSRPVAYGRRTFEFDDYTVGAYHKKRKLSRYPYEESISYDDYYDERLPYVYNQNRYNRRPLHLVDHPAYRAMSKHHKPTSPYNSPRYDRTFMYTQPEPAYEKRYDSISKRRPIVSNSAPPPAPYAVHPDSVAVLPAPVDVDPLAAAPRRVSIPFSRTHGRSSKRKSSIPLPTVVSESAQQFPAPAPLAQAPTKSSTVAPAREPVIPLPAALPPQQLQSVTQQDSSSVLEEATAENCAKIPVIASQFGISDVSAWAHGNCGVLQMFAPGASCQQIWHFIDSCKKRHFL